MIRSFLRITKNIESLEVVETFEDSLQALEYVQEHPVDAAFLDIAMPGISGIQLAQELRAINPEMRIVFVTAYDSYVRDSNMVDADYYVMKPYNEEIMRNVVSRLERLMPKVQPKSVFVQTFGRFVIYKNREPIALSGKTKEIMALVVSRRGKEISNEELYSTIWEDREYDNVKMKVYYNAVHRLKEKLAAAGISELLISTTRGQILNVDYCDCDFLSWLAGSREGRNRFEGEFMSEYTWGEEILADLLQMSEMDYV